MIGGNLFKGRKKGFNLFLGFWLLILLLINIYWLSLDKLPPAWDQAAHLKSMVLVNHWIKGQFWGSFRDLIGSFWGYPPLIYFIGGIWSWFFGLGITKITFLNTLFLIGAVIVVYKLAKEISKSNKVALLSAVIFSLLPVIGDISRNMLLDLPLLVWVGWGLYFWLKSNKLKKTGYAWGLLIMLILASLTKINGFLYFIPIGVLLLIDGFREGWVFWRRLLFGGLIYVLSVGWWWIIGWSNIYQYLTGLAGQGESLTDPMNLMEWKTWIHYLKLFFLHQAGPIVALFLGVFLWWVPKENKKNKKLLLWLLIVYVLFTIIKNKDFRFTLPLLMPVSIWIAWGLVEFGKRLSKNIYKLILILLLIWMSFNFLENGFNWPIKKPLIVSTPTFLFGDVDWVGFDDYPVRGVKKETWPMEKIVHDLSKEVKNDLKTKNVLVLINIEEFNDNNLTLYKTMVNENKLNFVSVGLVDQFNNENEIKKLIDKSDYLLVPERDYEAAPFYVVNLKAYNQVKDWAWVNKDSFETLEEYILPNSKKVYFLKKR
jgi:dolichyl-phosphate-mannose-protein mannosyltransferase